MISVQKPITGMESTETDAPEGETRIDLVIRTSRIYRQVEAQWKQSHHHGSIDDPAAQLLFALRHMSTSSELVLAEGC